MYKLCWIPTGWITPKIFRNKVHYTTFNTLDELKEIMSKCIYDGEWVEDLQGNKVDIDLRSVCLL